MFGIPFETALWLWILPFVLVGLQFVYCIVTDKQDK